MKQKQINKASVYPDPTEIMVDFSQCEESRYSTLGNIELKAVDKSLLEEFGMRAPERFSSLRFPNGSKLRVSFT